MEQDQENHALSEITEKLCENLTLQSSSVIQEYNHDNFLVIDDNEHENEDEDEDEDEDDFEFSFFRNEEGSLVTAEEAFNNGQIRSTFPLFGDVDNGQIRSTFPLFGKVATSSSYAPPVKKMFVADGPYCEWSTAEETTAAKITAVSPEMSRKSNSTGFSRLWRMKDYLLVRSNSDGKDTFVFLTGKRTTTTTEKGKTVNVGRNNGGEITSKNEGVVKEKKKKGKKKVGMTATATAYEELYGKRKGGGKSYLPYRQDLVGLFTSVNGLTRNVHPY